MRVVLRIKLSNVHKILCKLHSASLKCKIINIFKKQTTSVSLSLIFEPTYNPDEAIEET